MKILIVHSEPFLPVKSGACKVIYEYCNLLKKKGCELSYLYYGNGESTKEFVDYFDGRVYHYKKSFSCKFSISNIYRKLRRMWAISQKVDDFYPTRIERVVNKLNKKEKFDYCIVNYIILTKLFEKSDFPRKVLYSHDAFTNKNEWLNVQKFWFSLSPNEEAKGIRRCTDIISIQQNESILFKYYSPKSNVYTVYSPFQITRQPICGNKNILFIAGDNQLNYNGISWFLEKIFPLVLKQEPDANLIIGGNICNMIEKYSASNVILQGTVGSLETFYALGDIVVNPVYQGTGLKIKTFEALSYGKIVVAHQHSAEGIFKKEKAPLLLGETDVEIANLLVRALRAENRQFCSEDSLRYIQALNKYVSAEYDRLLEQ